MMICYHLNIRLSIRATRPISAETITGTAKKPTIQPKMSRNSIVSEKTVFCEETSLIEGFAGVFDKGSVSSRGLKESFVVLLISPEELVLSSKLIGQSKTPSPSMS